MDENMSICSKCRVTHFFVILKRNKFALIYFLIPRYFQDYASFSKHFPNFFYHNKSKFSIMVSVNYIQKTTFRSIFFEK